MSFSWPKKQVSVSKFDLEVLRTPDIEERFQLELSNRFSTLCEVSDPETLFVSIATAIKDTASQIYHSKILLSHTGCLRKPSVQ